MSEAKVKTESDTTAWLARKEALCAFDKRLLNDFREKTTVLQSRKHSMYDHCSKPRTEIHKTQNNWERS